MDLRLQPAYYFDIYIYIYNLKNAVYNNIQFRLVLFSPLSQI